MEMSRFRGILVVVFIAIVAIVASTCGRFGVDSISMARCDEEFDPDAYCSETFGEGFLCRPTAEGSYCMQLSCASDEDCQWLDTPCRVGVCSTSNGACEVERLEEGSPCDDGYTCTDSRCDEQGMCIGLPLSERCDAGDTCQPICFGGETGCGAPPTALTVNCADSTTATTECVLFLDGGASDQSDCLSCSVHVGYQIISLSDFEDDTGACTADDWELTSGAVCSTSVPSCDASTGSAECCDDIATICTERRGDAYLQSVLEENCGDQLQYPQWRISKTFNATGLTDLGLCFDAGEAYASTGDAVIATVSTSDIETTNVACFRGSNNWRGGTQTLCADLPPETNDSDDLLITFIAHVNGASPDYPDDTRRMRLDNVLLYGFDPSCNQRDRQVVFSEDFETCTDRVREGWNGWTVTGRPECSPSACQGSGQGVIADDEEWTLSRTVDTSSLAGGVQVCVNAGNVGATSEDLRLWLDVDVGDGSGWTTVDHGSIYRAEDNECETICFGLSHLGPRVAGNPALGVRLSVSSPQASWLQLLDDITVSGLSSCDGSSFVSMSPIAETSGDLYSMTIENLTDDILNARIRCSWNGVSPTLASHDYVVMR